MRNATRTTVITGAIKGGPAIEVRIGTPASDVSLTLDIGQGQFQPTGTQRDMAFGAVLAQLAHRSYLRRSDHDGVTTFDLGEIRIG